MGRPFLSSRTVILTTSSGVVVCMLWSLLESSQSWKSLGPLVRLGQKRKHLWLFWCCAQVCDECEPWEAWQLTQGCQQGLLCCQLPRPYLTTVIRDLTTLAYLTYSGLHSMPSQPPRRRWTAPLGNWNDGHGATHSIFPASIKAMGSVISELKGRTPVHPPAFLLPMCCSWIWHFS